MSNKEYDVSRNAWSKVAEKFVFHMAKNLRVSKSFCRRNTLSEACVMFSNEWGQPLPEDVQIVHDTFGSTLQ